MGKTDPTLATFLLFRHILLTNAKVVGKQDEALANIKIIGELDDPKSVEAHMRELFKGLWDSIQKDPVAREVIKAIPWSKINGGLDKVDWVKFQEYLKEGT